MKRLLFIVFLYFSALKNSVAQTADLRIVGNAQCATNKFEALIQIKAQSGTLKIGTSSILLNYNTAALGFVSYASENFDPNDLCIANTASSWDTHATDGATAGTFNLTMTLLNNDFSCPTITTDWITVGKVVFNIVNINQNPQITFSTANTNFNSVPANDGSNPIGKGIFSGFNALVSCCEFKCATITVTKL